MDRMYSTFPKALNLSRAEELNISVYLFQPCNQIRIMMNLTNLRITPPPSTNMKLNFDVWTIKNFQIGFSQAKVGECQFSLNFRVQFISI